MNKKVTHVAAPILIIGLLAIFAVTASNNSNGTVTYEGEDVPLEMPGMPTVQISSQIENITDIGSDLGSSTAKLAIDKKHDTKWTPDADQQNPIQLVIRLDAIYTVNNVKLYGFEGEIEDYKLEYMLHGMADKWMDIKGGDSLDADNSLHFTEVETDFIRLTINRKEGAQIRLAEIEINYVQDLMSEI